MFIHNVNKWYDTLSDDKRIGYLLIIALPGIVASSVRWDNTIFFSGVFYLLLVLALRLVGSGNAK